MHGHAGAGLASIGTALGEASSVAASPTTALAAAGADEVSAAVAALFSGHAEAFQAANVQVSAFHQQFVTAGGGNGRAG